MKWLLSAKNYQNWLINVKVIVCYVSVFFQQHLNSISLPGGCIQTSTSKTPLTVK